MEISKKLDCTGLFCPMPIIKTKNEIDSMRQGEVLEVVSDDPGFEKDLPVWCEAAGHRCLEVKKSAGLVIGLVQK